MVEQQVTDVRAELEEAIDELITAAVAAETASMRRELDALERWMKSQMLQMRAREALMCERLRWLQAMEVAQAEADDVAATRTLN